MMKIGARLLIIFTSLGITLLMVQCKNKAKNQIDTEAIVVDAYQPFENFNNDTLIYLKTNFVRRKDLYINKPLKLLFADFELPVKNYTYSIGDFPHIESILGIRIIFESQAIEYNKMNNYKVPNSIYVSLKQPINYHEIVGLGRKYKGQWTNEVKTYYDKLIVDNIITNKEPKSKN